MTDAQADALFKAITAAIERSVQPIAKQVAEIRSELAARKYCGTFQRAQEYRKHNQVTHAGSMWVALTDDPGIPGESGGWQLAAKKGADGRDAR